MSVVHVRPSVNGKDNGGKKRNEGGAMTVQASLVSKGKWQIDVTGMLRASGESERAS